MFRKRLTKPKNSLYAPEMSLKDLSNDALNRDLHTLYVLKKKIIPTLTWTLNKVCQTCAQTNDDLSLCLPLIGNVDVKM